MNCTYKYILTADFVGSAPEYSLGADQTYVQTPPEYNDFVPASSPEYTTSRPQPEYNGASGVAIVCSDCSRIATNYCTHANCEDSKNMCPAHLAMHTGRKSTKGHEVFPIEGARMVKVDNV